MRDFFINFFKKPENVAIVICVFIQIMGVIVGILLGKFLLKVF
tara:strand:- start:139 stop:267 length:129 start_codon:yes stop_codon:yes gene_type:complete